ncbi:hypothetical protein HELRODRAFT_89746 [Helobdella robusta]|uniref:Adenine phosphoribosyltransferase n=1 Tax=Helobdella robusta TaxID=6412 RepID=T1G7H1_HELRO|nr:hypothetical protein HELRODRAFT_89746 [Helobdella robusta]ESN92246.1 hypothetical protein HELRODRAFT_89746 [Helobdella robusta]
MCPAAVLDRESRRRSIADKVKSYPDFPKPGILFRDMFPLLRNPTDYRECINLFVEEIREKYPSTEVVVGIESRGFLFAPLMAQQLNVAFIPIRKAGKLPGQTISYSYALEYGNDTIEITRESIEAGQHVVVVDDLLATGGTLSASIELMNKAGASVECCMVLLELCDLKGRKKIKSPVYSMIPLN